MIVINNTSYKKLLLEPTVLRKDCRKWSRLIPFVVFQLDKLLSVPHECNFHINFLNKRLVSVEYLTKGSSNTKRSFPINAAALRAIELQYQLQVLKVARKTHVSSLNRLLYTFYHLTLIKVEINV